MIRHSSWSSVRTSIPCEARCHQAFPDLTRGSGAEALWEKGDAAAPLPLGWTVDVESEGKSERVDTSFICHPPPIARSLRLLYRSISSPPPPPDPTLHPSLCPSSGLQYINRVQMMDWWRAAGGNRKSPGLRICVCVCVFFILLHYWF